jgi:hypothetical protein
MLLVPLLPYSRAPVSTGVYGGTVLFLSISKSLSVVGVYEKKAKRPDGKEAFKRPDASPRPLVWCVLCVLQVCNRVIVTRRSLHGLMFIVLIVMFRFLNAMFIFFLLRCPQEYLTVKVMGVLSTMPAALLLTHFRPFGTVVASHINPPPPDGEFF